MKSNLYLILVKAVLLFVIVFAMNPTKTAAQSKLVVEGSVVGYELYKVRPIGIPMLYPMLVRVTKTIEGEEKSEFIKVLSFEINEDYAQKNYTLEKLSTLRLERRNFCGGFRIKSLMYPGLTIENGQVVETSQTFTLVPGIIRTSLPLKKKIPCYVTEEVSRHISSTL